MKNPFISKSPDLFIRGAFNMFVFDSLFARVEPVGSFYRVSFLGKTGTFMSRSFEDAVLHVENNLIDLGVKQTKIRA